MVLSLAATISHAREVAVVLPEDWSGQIFQIEGCEYSGAISSSGNSLIYECISTSAEFTVTDPGLPKTWTGLVSLRTTAAYDISPSEPIHSMELSVSANGGTASKKPESVEAKVFEVGILTPEIYGVIEVEGSLGSELEQVSSDGVQTVWKWSIDAAKRPDSLNLSVQNAPKCLSAISLVELSSGLTVEAGDFDCRAVNVRLPASTPLSNDSCSMLAPGEWSCLVSKSEQRFVPVTPGWEITNFSTTPDFSIEENMRAILPIGSNDPVLKSIASTVSCDASIWSAAFTGYCGTSEESCALVNEVPLTLEKNGLLLAPSLQEAAWRSSNGVPSRARIVFRNRLNANRTETLTFELGTASSFPPPLTTRSQMFAARPVYPVNAAINQGQFKSGRVLQIFNDRSCQQPDLESRQILDFAGTKKALANECQYYRILDNGASRGPCSALIPNSTYTELLAAPAISDCGEKRLVILVAESESTPPLVGEAVQTALRNVFADLHAKGTCAPVDLVRTASGRRNILLEGETVPNVTQFNDLWKEVRFAFSSIDNLPFEDFEWVVRKWGPRLGGIVIVVDAQRPTPVTALDAPAALLWAADNMYRKVLDVSGGRGCTAYNSILRMNDCQGIDPTFSSNDLEMLISQALEEIQ